MKIFKFASGLRRLFISSLFVSSVILTLIGGSHPAKALTAYFFGPAWDLTECSYAFPFPNCIDGAVSATVEFDGVADNFSGWIYTTPTSWSLNASGITSLSTGDTLYSLQFDFSSGHVVVGVMQAQNTASSVYRSIGTNGYGAYDYADTYDTGTGQYINNGYISYGGYNSTGAWINPKTIGQPASLPQETDPIPTGPIADTNPPANQRPNPPAQLAQVGEPIDVGTGNMFFHVTDYSTVGQNPLAFIRYYNSMASADTPATALGRNWRSNYDRYLRNVTANEVDAERSDGKIVTFINVSGTWTPDTDVDMTLTNSGSTYTLTDHDDTVETYTVASGAGTLNSIALPSGYTQTLNYTLGVLTSVSDSYSRSLSFTYTSGVLTGVSTPDSATLTYGYTTTAGQNLLTSITYNTSPSTSQTYVYGNSSYPFALTGITDENGNSYASWTYDTNGRCTMSEHAGGADEVQVTYTSLTSVTVTNPLGEQETYTLALNQGVYKVTEIDRAASSPVAAASEYFTYDTNGFLATATDWNGNSTHYTNDSHGDPTSITEAYGTGRARTTSVTYDSTWVHKPYTITKTNVTEDDRYDATYGTLTTRTLTDTTGGATNGDTEVWAYTYTSYGLLHTETFPRTATTVKNTYTYSSGALASISDQLSHTTTINTANGTGQPTEITDPNSVVTDFVYDNRNRLTSKTVHASPSNEVTTTSYIGSGQPYVVTLPDSSTITYSYDNAQRVTKIANTATESINYTLDAMGDITAYAAKDSGGTTRKSWTATYDVLGDRLTLVGAGGGTQTTTYSYDGNKNRLSIEDANSQTTSTTYDELNRPTTVTDPYSHTATPTYNNLDYLTNQTDFNGYSTGFTRDAFGNAIARTSPDTGSWSFTFDEDNNITGITDARSVATTNTYDGDDRLSGVSISGYSGEAESYTYDDTTSGNKGVGKLTSWSDESGSGSRVYDNFGNVTSTVQVIGGKTYNTSYSYDLANRLTEIIYPSGRYVDYTYDSSGYLTTVTTKPSSGGSVTTLASSITHKPFGPISGFTYGNSEAQTRSYDNNYWETALSTVYSGTYVQELSYTQDYAGNFTGITDTLDSTRNESFGVDDLNRLHTASGKYGSYTYTYDNNSNLATKYDGTTTYTTTQVSSENLPDHITDGTNTRHFTWTANGNMATDDRTFVGGGSMSATYGGRNLLESMTVNSQGITYKLNAFGQRVSEAFSGSTTHYIHDIRGNAIAEADGSTGTTTMEYVWMEGELLAQIDGSGNIVYVHNNQVGAPQKITNPSRTLVWDQIIKPFGEIYSTPTSTTPTNWRFPGQYANANNSLSHNGARDYDSSGPFYIESDPIGLVGGLNPISYARQNPAQNIDPLGLITVVVINNNDPITGTHAGLYITNGSDNQPTVYDPNSTYNPYDTRTASGTVSGNNVNWLDYYNFQKLNGANVQFYVFLTTPEEEQQIYKNAHDLGNSNTGVTGTLGLSCSENTSAALNGVGPFKNLGTYWFPSNLGSALSTLQNSLY
jgi:RHS repeat-associated protein